MGSPISHLEAKAFVFDTPGCPDLKLTGKRYTAANCDEAGITFVFAHCIGSHKEQWEPTIARMIQLQQFKDKQYRIREAWAFDWQNHGDGGVVNEAVIRSRFETGVSAYQWGLAIASAIRIAMHERRIILVGHSAGTGAIMMAMKEFPADGNPFISIFLVEPTILSQELFDVTAEKRIRSANLTKKLTLARRDRWSSKEEARIWFRTRKPWNKWDPLVFETFIEHGLQIIPEDGNPDSVCLKCDKHQEGVSYPEFAPYIESAALFQERCKLTPFHVIFGAQNDFVSTEIQHSLCDLTKNRMAATITRIPGVGHLIVQERPGALAKVISERLDSDRHFWCSRL